MVDRSIRGSRCSNGGPTGVCFRDHLYVDVLVRALAPSTIIEEEIGAVNNVLV